jgi:L-serine dehydratase
MGGSPKQAFQAASLALQNTLGLICDPVCGVGNVPCISRNASGVANSLISANMVLAGFDPFIPLDEVIEAMKKTGLMLPPELRCTGGGGLCQTKTAIEAGRGLDLTPNK